MTTVSGIRGQRLLGGFPVVALMLVHAAAAVAGQPSIHSNAPTETSRTVTLVEQWRAGGEDDEHIFGLLTDARCDTEGNVYLLDHQLSRITVVSPAGEYLAELGGEGDGPDVSTEKAINPYDLGPTLAESLADYIAAHSPVATEVGTAHPGTRDT